MEDILLRSRQLLAIVTVFTAGTLGLAESAKAATLNPPASPDYRYIFQDAVTGDNAFIGNDGDHHWFINTSADSYAIDQYERPTAQTYKPFTADSLVGDDSELVQGETYYATDKNSPAYFEYLDIVTGRFDYDANYMYFAIELYGDAKVDSNGGERTVDFGESSVYRIRLGENANANNSILLSAKNAKDAASSFVSKETFAFYDENGDVGGSAITTVHENPGSMNGFEREVVADGWTKDANADSEILFVRRLTNAEGRPVVEFAFDYQKYNTAFSFPDINPDNGLPYLVFEANRGTKDEQNYLWNDKYTIGEAGTPYDDGNGEPQNVYELDTLTSGPINIIDFEEENPPKLPEPRASLGMLWIGAIGARSLLKRINR